MKTFLFTACTFILGLVVNYSYAQNAFVSGVDPNFVQPAYSNNQLLTTDLSYRTAFNLNSFSTMPNNNDIAINWQTREEENIKGFYIERKADGTHDWEQVAFINTLSNNGVSKTPILYNYIDKDLKRGVVYNYRLSQLDRNGQTQFSTVQTTKVDIINSERVSVYPNPTRTGQVSVTFNGAGIRNDVLLVDMAGHNIKQWSRVSNNRIDINSLKTGVYTLVVRDRQFNEEITRKIVVQ